MSRILTISELYALLLHEPKALELADPTLHPIQLNHRSTMMWAAPGSGSFSEAKPAPAGGAGPAPRTPRRVPITAPLMHVMEAVAAACGITEVDAWSEAAQTWIAQRQTDMVELATPAGQELATRVRQIWSAIDEQLVDIRSK